MDEITGLFKDLKETVNSYFGWVYKIGLLLVIPSTLFLFTNATTDLYDTPKFLVLTIITLLLFILLSVKFTLDNKVTFVRTPLDLPLLLLLAVSIVSTVLSQAPFVSLLGNGLKVHTSLVALVAYILFYFVLVNCLKGARETKWVLNLLILGGGVLSILSLLAYWGVKILPPPWVQTANFTPSGSSFSTTAVLALLTPIVTLKILRGKSLEKVINSICLSFFGVTLALTGSWPVWVAAGFGFALPVLLSIPAQTYISKPGEILSRMGSVALIGLIVSLGLVMLVTILSFIPPVGGAQNPFYAKAREFPREIQLPFTYSWKISVSSFRDSPFWGSGPSTYLFDFTKYKPIEINSSKTLWNLRFDSAFNEYLQVLATLGGIGFVALVSLTALFVSSAYKTISGAIHLEGEEMRLHLRGEKLSLAISGLTFFILLALHPSTLVLWVVGLILLVCFMISNQSEESSEIRSSGSIKEVLLGLTGNISLRSSSQAIRIDALPSILLTIAIALSLFGFFFAGKFALADFHHRNALNAVSENQGIVAYNELIAAEKLNPYADLYRVDLAQVNFALANAIAQSKGPTEASPSGSLTDQDKQNIQVLLQQSINEGRTATTLSPNSAVNWEILALLYRQIAGVAQNALVFSLDSYGRAIFQDPLNPLLRISVGGTYYAIRNYDLAIRFFTDSVNLKPDFANGYYNLSVALRDKGDLNTAQAAAEKALSLVDPPSPEYKVAFDYLNDLKNRIASGSAQASEIQPPASQTTGALQNKELPKVVNVGNPPEKIATPPAVPKPSPTPIP
ncbi:MAG: Uncharacterized protein G01um10147_1122 [Microgenomates group bacterium Gr01-1014_7]|nr:MAG: Uncharacterized protein G01um10147_1122 [Microgenomates group bacterium Gr01-1014_7]